MWYRKKHRIGLITAGITLLSSMTYAVQDENAVKAAFIYNFTNFIKWQDLQGGSKKVNVCTVGEETSVTGYLNELSKKVPIIVSIKGRDARLSDCHVLYIGFSNRSDVDYLLGRSEGTQILTVSSATDFARRGGMIGFTNDAGQVKLEANVNTIHKAGLAIDSDLLELVHIVK